MPSALTTKSSRGEGRPPASRDGRPHPAAALAIALATLCAFFTLFLARALDDNRLTSWRWVFADADVPGLLAILAGGLTLAWALVTVPLPPRGRPAALFFAAFFLAAAFWREPEVIVDAARYSSQAKQLALHGIGHFVREWGRAIPAWTDLPAVPFLYGVIFAVFGEDRLAIQVFTTLLFAATVVLTYRLGRTLWDESVGVYAGALLLSIPYLLAQVPLMLADVPAMFFLMLAIVAVTSALRRGGPARIAGASLALALALLVKFSTWLLLAVVPVVALVHLSAGRRVVCRRAAAILAVSLSAVAAVIVLKADVFAEQLRLLERYQVPGLSRWRESFASTFLFQVHPFLSAAALASLALGLRARDARYALVAWPVLLALALGVERARYLVVVFPMLALMAAYGLRAVGDAAVRRFVGSAIVVSSLVVALFGYLPHLTATSAINLKHAGEYLDRLGADAVEVVTLPQPTAALNPAVSVPLLDLYTRVRLVHRGAGASVPPPGVETSPLRFSWEAMPPRDEPAGSPPAADGPLVVILARPDQPLPGLVRQRVAGHRLAQAFQIADRWFEYQTVVHIYERRGPYAERSRR